MTIKLMMDVHIPRQVVNGLRLNGVDVLTAQEDDAEEIADPILMDRATAYGRVLVSFDADMLIEAHYRQLNSIPFSGLVFARPFRISTKKTISDLILLTQVFEDVDMENQVEYIPLQ